MSRPVVGPSNPWDTRLKGMNTIAGHVEDHAIAAHSFNSQQRSFAINGYASNPSTSAAAPQLVGDMKAASQSLVKQSKKEKRKRNAKGDLTVVDGEGAYKGPWASFEGDEDGAEEEETEEALVVLERGGSGPRRRCSSALRA